MSIYTTLRLAVRPAVKSVSQTQKVLFSKKYLLFTNTFICSSMSAVGDILQQKYQIYSGNKTAWDAKRTAKVAATGFLIGPFCHYWYIFLDWWLPGRALKTVVKKLVVDQFVCTPIYIGLFLITLGVFEEGSWEKIKDNLVDKGSTLCLTEWIIWPPAQLINFFFLPTRYRVIYDNIISLGFDCYYPYVQYDKDKHDSEEIVTTKETESQDK